MVAPARILTAIRKAGTLKGAAEALGGSVQDLRKSIIFHAIEEDVEKALATAKAREEIRGLDREIRARVAKRDASTGRRREAHQETLDRLLARREVLRRADS